MADIQVIKQSRQPVVHHLNMLLADLLTQGTGNIRFPAPFWPGDQHIFITVDISAGQQLYQQLQVQSPFRPVVKL